MKNKKIVTIIMCVVMLLTSTSAFAVDVYVDSTLTRLSDANGNTVEPIIRDGSTYVPLRGVSQALGCQVKWDGDNRSVMIYQKNQPSEKTFHNSSDEVKVYIDDENVELKDVNNNTVNPFIIDGTTYVPLRGISQALGCQVEWDGTLQRVSIYQNTISPNGATLDFLRPYKTDYVSTYYESDGDVLTIDNIDYTNAIAASSFIMDKEVCFNLDGKYTSISFVGGSTGNFDSDKNITFIVDGKIVDIVTIEANSAAKEYSVDLNKGLQLKILMEDGYIGSCIGMGNIVFR